VAWRAFYGRDCGATVVAARNFEAGACQTPQITKSGAAHALQKLACMKALVMVVVACAACTSSDGTIGSATVEYYPSLTGAFYDATHDNFTGQATGWHVSFTSAAPGTPCGGSGASGGPWFEMILQLDGDVPPIAPGNYESTTAELGLHIYDDKGLEVIDDKGSLTITSSDDSELAGTLMSSDYGILADFSAGRCDN
jgi:hypothetical protein